MKSYGLCATAVLSVAMAAISGCAFDSIDANAVEDESSSEQPIAAVGSYGWLTNASLDGTSQPVAENSYNSAGSVNTVTRTAKGKYTVLFKNLSGASRGHGMVTAFNFNLFSGPTPERCKATAWGLITGGIQMFVRCDNAAGLPADSMFTASWFAPSTADQGGYAYYAAGSLDRLDTIMTWTRAGTVTATHDALGKYTVRFNNVGASTTERGNAVVMATGNNGNYCNVNDLGTSSTTAIVMIACFNSSGGAADESFAVDYALRGVHAPGEGEYLRANQTTNPSYQPFIDYSFNALGTAHPQAARSGTGLYATRYPDMPWTNKVVAHASAYGVNSNYCKVGINFNMTSPQGTTSSVFCYNSAGVLVDSQYSHQIKWSGAAPL